MSLHINLMGFVEAQVDDQAMQLENMLWRVGHKESLRGDAAVRNSMPLNFRKSSMKLFRRDTLTSRKACPICVRSLLNTKAVPTLQS